MSNKNQNLRLRLGRGKPRPFGGRYIPRGIVLKLLTATLFLLAIDCQAMIPFCTSDKTMYKNADVVFIGTVMDKEYVDVSESTWDVCSTQEHGSSCGPNIGRVKVHKVIKGKVANEVTLSAEDSCNCTGAFLGEGYTYKFFAKHNKQGADFSAMGHCGTKVIRDNNYGK